MGDRHTVEPTEIHEEDMMLRNKLFKHIPQTNPEVIPISCTQVYQTTQSASRSFRMVFNDFNTDLRLMHSGYGIR